MISLAYQDQPLQQAFAYRRAIVGLLILSSAALAVTVWIMVDFLREQEIVEELIKDLPRDARDSAEFLAGELRWQFRLATLVVLNVVVTAFAVILLWRAYFASQTSLRDTRALATDILSSMQQAVITTDLDGIVTSINRRGIELLDVKASCIGEFIDEWRPASLGDFRRGWLSKKAAGMAHELTLESKGNSRTLRLTCQALNDHAANEIGIVFQLLDITRHRLIEDRMRRMERYMGLGSLAAGLHHEIKNPLAGLSLHVQLLEEHLGSVDPSEEITSMLDVIRSEVVRIGGVLEGFNDFASIGELNSTDVDLCEVIQRQIAFVGLQAENQSVRIHVDRCDSSLRVAADRGRIEQVILNLMINAMDAMPDGGDIKIAVYQADDAAHIDIADTGSGIPENLQDKILDPYFTTKSTGTGLGLAFCEKIMRQHSGAIDFSTSPNGTIFQLTLPKCESAAVTS
ncbi:MAG: ATP-binding protein [Fuerstiella sp.]